MANMQFPIRIWWAIMQYKFLSAFTLFLLPCVEVIGAALYVFGVVSGRGPEPGWVVRGNRSRSVEGS